MRAVIPYKNENAKSRLSPILSKKDREEFVELMLKDVIKALDDAEVVNIDILTTSAEGIPNDFNGNVTITEPGLNDSINEYLQNANEPILIIMADLPLVTGDHIRKIISFSEDVVIVPGKGGGTNILFIRHPNEFTVKYHDCSFISHCEITDELDKSMHIFDSFLASTDIDEPHDIVELMLHGKGQAKEYAEKRFGSETGKGRVKISHLSKLSGFV
ncbi:2-phospho-L-lactate guanylyltransferase [Methanococcoides burtonii]|uniref:2-phospho-L-lactate guanylyltransferase n=1 Tax=Methanococcoides burtonii (strain DSM 6242 / NBRC 107633 / OCM 468 / ACE-M) TaxID=259564 RepID=COFC_METBU|nr:2-phospho-L-lactate guanylyltransferase [Methanococcoides burtonii]Q12WF3.2 RecName: Full=2-phospho-L-lactate guanylyltransferase; Short=LP guanylyltransferase [Methanococcoides burtonii DSM 6242]